MLEIKNLKASTDDKEILKGLNLIINKGEVHAIMGTNGSGKSTLSKVLTGHPAYSVDDGEIFFENTNIKDLSPDERAQLGIFLAFLSSLAALADFSLLPLLCLRLAIFPFSFYFLSLLAILFFPIFIYLYVL